MLVQAVLECLSYHEYAYLQRQPTRGHGEFETSLAKVSFVQLVVHLSCLEFHILTSLRRAGRGKLTDLADISEHSGRDTVLQNRKISATVSRGSIDGRISDCDERDGLWRQECQALR